METNAIKVNKNYKKYTKRKNDKKKRKRKEKRQTNNKYKTQDYQKKTSLFMGEYYLNTSLLLIGPIEAYSL